MSVYSIYPRNQYIVETGVVLNIFNVNKIIISSVNLEVLWGVPYISILSSSTMVVKPPVPFTLYKPTSVAPQGYPFNNIKVKFNITLNTPP